MKNQVLQVVLRLFIPVFILGMNFDMQSSCRVIDDISLCNRFECKHNHVKPEFKYEHGEEEEEDFHHDFESFCVTVNVKKDAKTLRTNELVVTESVYDKSLKPSKSCLKAISSYPKPLKDCPKPANIVIQQKRKNKSISKASSYEKASSFEKISSYEKAPAGNLLSCIIS